MAVVQDGRYKISDILGDSTITNYTDTIKIGSDGTSTTDTMSDIQTLVDSTTGLSATTPDNLVQLSATFTGNSASIEETSIHFDDGTMLARQTFAAVNVGTDDSIQIDWEIQNTSA